ncbi:MAG: hypothetical protein D6765_08100 [Bacteroidetes bacterium]|nr:MAG: hypothetical protein D6765_08100 [Bacteroidota bacterium]
MSTDFFQSLAELFTQHFGILGLIIVILLFVVYQLLTKSLSDKDRQIERLADENREYRERFTQLLDRHFRLGSRGESAPHDEERTLAPRS